WLSQPDCPPAIRECKFLFDNIAVAVPEDLYALIKRHTAVICARLKFDGVFYSRASTHVGNSQIFFYPQGDRLSSPVPGSIQHIYAMPAGELVFAVCKLLPLDCHDQIIDPFAMYPPFPAKMYSSSFSSHLENVKVSWVVSHFARWVVSTDTVVILSLSRVSTV
ncbi:hypothetical protein EV424DRAFT_1304658, partial [Suillus variegatus]